MNENFPSCFCPALAGQSRTEQDKAVQNCVLPKQVKKQDRFRALLDLNFFAVENRSQKCKNRIFWVKINKILIFAFLIFDFNDQIFLKFIKNTLETYF